MLTVDQLFIPLTEAQVKAKLYELAAALGLPTTSWVSGAPTRVIIAVLAKLYGFFLAPLLVVVAKSGFLDDAEEGWLTLLASLVYGVTRRAATFATGEVTLVNGGGGVYSFEANECVLQNSATGATYVAAEAFDLLAGQTITVSVRAEAKGSASNAEIGAIDTIVTTMLEVTVLNADEVIGIDEETDPELRDRCRARLGALSPNGPADAYRYVALTPELNGGANVNRALVLDAVGDNTVEVIVAAPDGAPSPADVALVQTAEDTYATPDTVDCIVSGATELALSYSLTAHVSTGAGLTDDQWEETIASELVAWVRTLPIGGIRLAPPAAGAVPWRTVEGVVERIQLSEDGPFFVVHCQLSSETDTPLALSEVATLDAGDVTVAVVQVPV